MFNKFIKYSVLFILLIISIGSIAYITFSYLIKNQISVIVPDLIGKDTVYTIEILSGLGLNAKIKDKKFSNTYLKGIITEQIPEPGSEIKKGRDIKITVSKGAYTVSFSDLKNIHIDEAKIIIEKNGLCIQNISYTYNNKFNKDLIISQQPEPKTMLYKNTCINLLVSLGRRPIAIKMPDLSGLSVDDAVWLIDNYNLSLGKISSSYFKNRPYNVITEQKPVKGYRIFERQPVDLIINRKIEKKYPASFDGTHGVWFYKYKNLPGFIKSHIKIKLKIYGTLIDIVDQMIKPDKEIWVLIPQNTNTIFYVYIDDELILTKTYDAF